MIPLCMSFPEKDIVWMKLVANRINLLPNNLALLPLYILHCVLKFFGPGAVDLSQVKS